MAETRQERQDAGDELFSEFFAKPLREVAMTIRSSRPNAGWMALVNFHRHARAAIEAERAAQEGFAVADIAKAIALADGDATGLCMDRYEAEALAVLEVIQGLRRDAENAFRKGLTLHPWQSEILLNGPARPIPVENDDPTESPEFLVFVLHSAARLIHALYAAPPEARAKLDIDVALATAEYALNAINAGADRAALRTQEFTAGLSLPPFAKPEDRP